MGNGAIMAAPWEAYQETKTEPSKQEGPWAKFSEEKTLAEKPFIERQKTAISPVTDVLNRALVAQTIGAPVDIATMAMRPFGYKTQAPIGGSQWMRQKAEALGIREPESTDPALRAIRQGADVLGSFS